MEMKGLAFLLCILATSECFSGYMNLINEEWETYKTKYDKNYASPVEEGFRMKRYLENKLKIAEHNQRYYDGEESFYLGINSLSDRLPHEIAAMNGFKQEDADKHNNAAFTFIGPDDDIELPASYDWRTKGAVTDIKNQGQCGSCWAFSSTGSLEGQHFRKTGKLVSLSEQNLMDCDKLSYSCEGGLMSTAFDYVKNNSGIDTEASYPYLADDEMCKFKRSDVGATDKGYVNITKGDENDLKKAVATIGPISVAIDASHDSFQAYGGGVYYEPDCNATLLDHGVLAVGYGTNEKGEDYWIVKNSWGKDWGLEGYILMARNRDNACGIASMALYPLV